MTWNRGQMLYRAKKIHKSFAAAVTNGTWNINSGFNNCRLSSLGCEVRMDKYLWLDGFTVSKGLYISIAIFSNESYGFKAFLYDRGSMIFFTAAGILDSDLLSEEEKMWFFQNMNLLNDI